jgi:hypothetical protein
MSQLRTILNNYDSFFIDFRSGSFLNRGSAGGSVSKNNSPVIQNAYAKVDSSNYYKCGGCNIGTDDFTVIVKGAVVDEHTGLGNCRPLILNGSNLRLTINGSNYDSTATVDSLKDRVIGVSADRDGNALFYANNAQLGSLVDISGSSAINILNAVYTIEGDTGYDQAEWVLMIKGKALTESEINLIVSELNRKPDQRVESQSFYKRDGYKFNGASAYGDLSETLTFRHDEDWEVCYYWKFQDPGITQVLFGDSGDTGEYAFLFDVGTRKYVFYTGGYEVGFDEDFVEGDLYFIENVFNATTKIWTCTRTNISDGGRTEVKTKDLTGLGSFTYDFDIIGKRGGNNRYLDGEIFDLQIVTNKNHGDIIQTSTKYNGNNTFVYVPRVFFKGEMHALANERTISSGMVENTPFIIDSGSVKVVTEIVDNYECRVIECVTKSAIALPTQGNKQSVDWHFKALQNSTSVITRFGFLFNAPNPNWSAGGDRGFVWRFHQGNFRVTDEGIAYINSDIANYNAGQWYDIRIRKDGDNFTCWIDGEYYNVGSDISDYNNLYFAVELNPGDKFIYASKNPKQSLFNKV